MEDYADEDIDGLVIDIDDDSLFWLKFVVWFSLAGAVTIAGFVAYLIYRVFN